MYPSSKWENNENYINDQCSLGGINIWKYWSGIALQDSLAFFAIGQNNSGIVNQARYSIYFIYMLNLYINYSLRYFEHKLIDREFVSIENIHPLYLELQRLKNQFISEEVSSRFQPNYIHEAIIRGMRTKEILAETKENMRETLELTRQNTGIFVTVAITLFSIAGFWLNHEMLANLFNSHPWSMSFAGLIALIVIITAILMRSNIVRIFNRFARRLYKIFQTN